MPREIPKPGKAKTQVEPIVRWTNASEVATRLSRAASYLGEAREALSDVTGDLSKIDRCQASTVGDINNRLATMQRTLLGTAEAILHYSSNGGAP